MSEYNFVLNLLVFIPIGVIGYFLKGLIDEFKQIQILTRSMKEENLELKGRVELYNASVMKDIENIQATTAIQLQQLTKDVGELTKTIRYYQQNQPSKSK